MLQLTQDLKVFLQATWAEQAGRASAFTPPSEPGDCGSGEVRTHPAHPPLPWEAPWSQGAEPLSQLPAEPLMLLQKRLNFAFYSMCVCVTGYVCTCV